MAKETNEWQEVTGEFGKSIRWTEEPARQWEEENSIFIGTEVHGILEDIRENIGENDSRIFEIYTPADEIGLVSVWENTVLADKMKKVMIGSEVKIEYLGEVKPKSGGKNYKQFKVLYRENPDKALMEVINAMKLKEMAEGKEVTAEEAGMEE